MFRVGFGSTSMNGGIEVVYRSVRMYLNKYRRRYFARSSRQSFDVMYDVNLMLDSSSRLAWPCLAYALRLHPFRRGPPRQGAPDDDVGVAWAFKPQLHLHILYT